MCGLKYLPIKLFEQESGPKFKLNFVAVNPILHGHRYPRLATSCLKVQNSFMIDLVDLKD